MVAQRNDKSRQKRSPRHGSSCKDLRPIGIAETLDQTDHQPKVEHHWQHIVNQQQHASQRKRMIFEIRAGESINDPILASDHHRIERRLARVVVQLSVATKVTNFVDRLPLLVALEPVDRERIVLD